MAAKFDEGGLRFRYPENWRLEREQDETGWTVSLQSPNTAFLMVCLREDGPDTQQLAEAALEALKEDYPELEADACVDPRCDAVVRRAVDRGLDTQRSSIGEHLAASPPVETLAEDPIQMLSGRDLKCLHAPRESDVICCFSVVGFKSFGANSIAERTSPGMNRAVSAGCSSRSSPRRGEDARRSRASRTRSSWTWRKN